VWCNNRLVCTTDWWAGTVLLIVIAFPYLLLEAVILPSEEKFSHIVLTTLFALCVVLYVFAVGIDPGIVPPRGYANSPTGSHVDTTVVSLARQAPSSDCALMIEETVSSAARPDSGLSKVPILPEPSFDADAALPSAPTQSTSSAFTDSASHPRYCRTCEIIRGPEVVHCSVCDYCVDGYDHHCGVIGSCVAKRTFRFFALFVFASFFLCSYALGRAVYDAVAINDWSSSKLSPYQTFRSFAVAWVILQCTLHLLVCVIPLSGLYVFLASTNLTQKRMWRYERNAGCVKHLHTCCCCSQGSLCCVGNFLQRLCGRMDRSLLGVEHLNAV
jgi:hypothetical protein